MAINYTTLAVTAKRLVEANGRDATFYRFSRTPADASKPWRGPAATPDATYTAKVAFVPVSGSGLGHLFRDTDDALVRRIQEVGIVASGSLGANTPSTADTLLDGTRVLKIVEVQELRATSTSLIFALGLET